MPLVLIESYPALEKATTPILVFTRQSAEMTSHGGCRRTAQLIHALSGFAFGLVTAEPFSPPVVDQKVENYPSRQILRHLYQGLDFLKKIKVTNGIYAKWSEEKRDYLLQLNLVASGWQKALLKNTHVKLAIVDDPIYFAPLVKYLRLRHIPVIVHCHNIESLSTSQVIHAHQKEVMRYELELLAMCQLVITISREETFLLRNLGIENIYLPYFPALAIQERLLSIRKNRNITVKKDVLLLGSVGNLPTLIGMKAFLHEWRRLLHADDREDRIIVAGFGTEQLLGDVSDSGIIFRGAISDHELNELLARVKAAVVYQENGSGALTKICEFLLAGVPVLANGHAARSYYNLPGIFEFTNCLTVPSILERIAAGEGKTAEPVAPDYSELFYKIKDLMLHSL